MISPTKSTSARINVNKPKTPKSALAAKATHEREKRISRVNTKTEKDARIMLDDGEVVQSPVHRKTFDCDGSPISKRRLRGMPDNESASNRSKHNQASSAVTAPRRSDRHRGLSTSATVPQDDDGLIETEPLQVRRLPS